MSDVEIFEIGDEVMLKSGSGLMYIKDVLDGSYECYWDDDDGKHRESTFSAKLLTKFEDETLDTSDIYISKPNP